MTFRDDIILRVAARYKKKTKDSEGNIHYEYSERQIADGHREKAKRLKGMESSIGKLRKDLKKKLSSGNPKEHLTALAVALMDETFERVGNDSSAEEGHFGVTGWLKKHLTFKGNKAIVKYTGKSGVEQKKEINTSSVVSALKKSCDGKRPGDAILSFDEGRVTCTDVNSYLKDFDITSKDLRGFHANREMRERLKSIRGAGSKLPSDKKEKEKVLKEEFKQALEETADAVGHTTSILRSAYLVPGLEDDFIKDGAVKKASKSDAEKEDDSVKKRMQRKSPKKKPPRRDLRNRTMDHSDPDTESNSQDDDLSLNYKKVGGSDNSQSFLYTPAHISGDDRNYSPFVSPCGNQFKATNVEVHDDHHPPGVTQMTKRISKTAAIAVSGDLDKLASLFQENYEALGVDADIAQDFAYRCDLLSDNIERHAGVDLTAGGEPESQSVPETDGWNPVQIGEQESGALKNDADEPYTAENFTQQENRELRQKQEAGQLPGVDARMATDLKKKLYTLESKVAQLVGGMSDEEAYSYAEELSALETSVKTCEAEVKSLDNAVSTHRGSLSGEAVKGLDQFGKLPAMLKNQCDAILELRDLVLKYSTTRESYGEKGFEVAEVLRMAVSNVRDAVSREKARLYPLVRDMKGSALGGSLMDVLEKIQFFFQNLSTPVMGLVDLATLVVEASAKSAKKAVGGEKKADKKAADDEKEEEKKEEKEEDDKEGSKKASVDHPAPTYSHGYSLFA